MTNFVSIESLNPLRLCQPLVEGHESELNYRPATGLTQAADTAMMLGVPLLLTGEPGTGKTRAAYWLSRELGAPLLRYDTKSSSAGRDLLYSFDEVARFRDANQGHIRPLIEYVSFNALGEAILRAAGGTSVLTDLSGKELEGPHFAKSSSLIKRAFGDEALSENSATTAQLANTRDQLSVVDPEHCIVLIDEFDKAPRDTPNDLLAEFENMGFAIPELGLAVTSSKAFKPIVLITSNSEKLFPEAFLRRCAFFDIPNPDGEELAEIVDGAIASLGGKDGLVVSAITVFLEFRSSDHVRKKPGTAELLAWLGVLQKQEKFLPDTCLLKVLRKNHKRLDNCLAAILKTRDDIAAGRVIMQELDKPA